MGVWIVPSKSVYVHGTSYISHLYHQHPKHASKLQQNALHSVFPHTSCRCSFLQHADCFLSATYTGVTSWLSLARSLLRDLHARQGADQYVFTSDASPAAANPPKWGVCADIWGSLFPRSLPYTLPYLYRRMFEWWRCLDFGTIRKLSRKWAQTQRYGALLELPASLVNNGSRLRGSLLAHGASRILSSLLGPWSEWWMKTTHRRRLKRFIHLIVCLMVGQKQRSDT